jgi:hypothetical protein
LFPRQETTILPFVYNLHGQSSRMPAWERNTLHDSGGGIQAEVSISHLCQEKTRSESS